MRRGHEIPSPCHYYTFDDGNHWIKAGPDIPENFLAHDFDAHGGRKGALDYIADRGANCIYFLPNNVGGDGDDTWPPSRSTTTRRGTTTGSCGSGTNCSGTPSAGVSCSTSSSRKPSPETRTITTTGISVPSGSYSTAN